MAVVFTHALGQAEFVMGIITLTSATGSSDSTAENISNTFGNTLGPWSTWFLVGPPIKAVVPWSSGHMAVAQAQKL